jgi:hypothetical protein
MWKKRDTGFGTAMESCGEFVDKPAVRGLGPFSHHLVPGAIHSLIQGDSILLNAGTNPEVLTRAEQDVDSFSAHPSNTLKYIWNLSV